MPEHHRLSRLGAVLMAVAVPMTAPMTTAWAQTPGSAAKPNTTIPEKQHLGSDLGPVNPSHDGVITPKHDNDPDMTKKPPPQSPNETPVIPPSATQGGNEAK
jgi:hypothetical protein